MGWVVNATSLPPYARERPGTHCIGGWLGPVTVWTGAEKPPPGFDPRTQIHVYTYRSIMITPQCRRIEQILVSFLMWVKGRY
jgi:hypothetical protein